MMKQESITPLRNIYIKNITISSRRKKLYNKITDTNVFFLNDIMKKKVSDFERESEREREREREKKKERVRSLTSFYKEIEF